MVLGIAVAIFVPLIFLMMVRWLDLYATGSFRGVLICLGWGLVAFVLAFVIENNTPLLAIFGYAFILTFLAPILEEILKSLVLVYYVRRPDFTYFVDGAIYGFAAGVGFAVFENWFYLTTAGNDPPLLIAIGRVFSTALMHGSATGIVGVTMGRLRFGRGARRIASLPLGLLASMTLHITFNNWVSPEQGIFKNLLSPDLGVWTVIGAFIMGLSGVGMTAGFIFWGLRQEQAWLRETLKLDVGVTSGESRVVQSLDDLDALLKRLEGLLTDYFGPEKRKQVETFLHLQVQLGLKRKVASMTPDDALRVEMETQMAELQKEINAIRRELGVYTMSSVRMLVPWEAVSMFDSLRANLESKGVREPTHGKSMFASVDRKIEKKENAERSKRPSTN